MARKLGDENLSRPWSRHSKKKVSEVTALDVDKPARAKGRVENPKDGVGVHVDDPQLQDFLQVMQPRVKSKLWANDTSVVTNVGDKLAMSNKDNKVASVATDESGSLQDEILDNSEHGEVVSDMDYFKSKVTSEWSDSESSGDEDDENDNSDDKDGHSDVSDDEENCDPRNGTQEVDLEAKEDTCKEDVAQGKTQVNGTEQRDQLSKPEDEKRVFESCRLFVRNLPYTTTYLYTSIYLLCILEFSYG